MTNENPPTSVVWEYRGGPHLALWRMPISAERSVHWLEAQEGTPGVIAIPRDGERLLLQRQFRPATGRSHLQFPRGFGEPELGGPLENAKRELAEETSLIAGDAFHLGSLYADPGILSGRADVVLVETDLSIAPRSDDEWEAPLIEEFVILTRGEVTSLIQQGQLDDALTLAALALLDAHEAHRAERTSH